MLQLSFHNNPSAPAINRTADLLRQFEPKESLARPRRILCIGDDPSLLQTRQLVLQSAGYEVLSLSSPAALIRNNVAGLDLAVICHTSSQQDVVIDHLHALNPQLPLLVLATVTGAHPVKGLYPITPQPDLLLSTVRQMLGDQHPTDRSHA